MSILNNCLGLLKKIISYIYIYYIYMINYHEKDHVVENRVDQPRLNQSINN